MGISATAVVFYVSNALNLSLQVISLSCLRCGCLQVKSGSEIILQNLFESFENLGRDFHLWLCNFRHCVVSPTSCLHFIVSFSWGSLPQRARPAFEAPSCPSCSHFHLTPYFPMFFQIFFICFVKAFHKMAGSERKKKSTTQQPQTPASQEVSMRVSSLKQREY